MPRTVKITEATWRKIAAVINDITPSRTELAERVFGSNLIRVRNNTGSTVGRFGVLKVTNSLILPQSNLLSFQQSTVLDGDIPDETSPFVITNAAAYNGAIVNAYASGVCPAKINVVDASHQFATAKSGDTTQLQSAASGVCSILWKESGTGAKWAVVRFGGAGGASGGGQVEVQWGKVIESPAYENPETYNLEGGRAYYTVRPVGTSYSIWSSSKTDYAVGDIVVKTADSPSYKALKSGAQGNVGKDPELPENSTYWKKQEEIRISRVFGFDDIDYDMRHFIPWFKPKTIIPYLQTNHPVRGLTYYIWCAMTYAGIDSEASLRWNQSQQRAMACYK